MRWPSILFSVVALLGFVGYTAIQAPASSLGGARELAIASGEYHQSWMRPGCGNERGSEDRAMRRFTGTIQNHPEFIAPLLADPDPKVRAAMILKLGWEKRTGYEKQLADAYLNERDATVREYIVGAMGRIGGKDVTTTLKKALTDSELKVKLVAAAALVHQGHVLDQKTRKKLDADAYKASTSSYMGMQYLFQD